MPWSSSNRRSTLPKDWPQRRARVKARANGICEHRDPTGKRCTNPGTECHHLGHPSDHRDEMLQWICAPCHIAETQQQSRAARHTMYVTAKKRPPEQHPGIRTP